MLATAMLTMDQG